MDEVNWQRVGTLLAPCSQLTLYRIATFALDVHITAACMSPCRAQWVCACLCLSSLVHLSSDRVWLIYHLVMKRLP